MQSSIFFNTIDERKMLPKYIERNKTQNEKVLTILKRNEPNHKMTASQVFRCWHEMNWPSVPITSIRRALCTLRDQGEVIKTDDKAVGMYGVNEYYYQYA